MRPRGRTWSSCKNFSGKHKAHGPLFLAPADEKGNLIWISAARPGRSSAITAARRNEITGHLREAGFGTLADLGFIGLDDDPEYPVIITGRKATRNHRLTGAEKEANRLLNRERAAVEHGFAKPRDLRNQDENFSMGKRRRLALQQCPGVGRVEGEFSKRIRCGDHWMAVGDRPLGDGVEAAAVGKGSVPERDRRIPAHHGPTSPSDDGRQEPERVSGSSAPSGRRPLLRTALAGQVRRRDVDRRKCPDTSVDEPEAPPRRPWRVGGRIQRERHGSTPSRPAQSYEAALDGNGMRRGPGSGWPPLMIQSTSSRFGQSEHSGGG
ncbi:transposase family protein [Streptomyces sp. NPDC090075]|uniref:transposase family protein n=1 Tax=Streptomyces sp. NPDC090075 TaxID=3365937 RepID=UPI00380DA185